MLQKSPALRLIVILAGCLWGGSAVAQEPPADLPNLRQLVERLSDLEAEVSSLRTPAAGTGTVAPANGQVPPSPHFFEHDEPAFVAPPPAPAPKKYPTVNVNGVFQADVVNFAQDEASREQLGDIQDGAGFRRTRLSASGAVAENVNYFVQMDFAFFGRPTFTDVWGEVKDVPWFGTVRAGQWKQPYSLEVPTSFRYQTFLERSLLFQAFDPFRHIGAGFYNNSEDEMWTWAMSVFRVGNDQFGDDIGDAGGWSTAGRLTHLFWYHDDQDQCKRLEYFHTGASFWFGDPSTDVTQYRTIPEMYVGQFGVPAGYVPGTSQVRVPTTADGTPPFVDTGAMRTNTFTHIGTEYLWAHGPFSWQGETQLAHVERPGEAALNFWGFYSQWMWFLTGESKPFNRKLGQIDRIVPLRPFLREPGGDWGPGAWEVAFRISHIDLDDENIHGGRLTDFTAGVNWYLNGYTKLQFNYVRAMLNRETIKYQGPSDTNIVGARFQVDF